VQAAGFPPGPHKSWQRGECNVSAYYRVKVTVTDATGLSATATSGSLYCDPLAW
jgi:hypothetical protein